MIMAALGPKARALVQEGRNGLRPAAGDRERVEAALRVHLGPGALPPAGSVAPPPLVAAAGWKAVAGALIGAGVIGGALYIAFGPERTTVPAAALTPPPTTSAAALAAAATPDDTPSEAPAAGSLIEPAPPVVVAPPSSDAPAPRPRDRLAEEVALLSRATKALRAGRAAEALKALDEHQAKFPRGALSEERRAAKAEALCSLGRVSEGRAELGRLAPQSPSFARAKQACDSGGKASPR